MLITPLNLPVTNHMQTGVVMDNPPPGKKFGDVLIAPRATYKAGDTAVAQFVGANPRVSNPLHHPRVCTEGSRTQNNLRLEQTFMTVDVLQNNTWTTVRSDSHPSTTFKWARTNGATGTSTVNTTW